MNFEYNCPYCDKELTGDFGANVYCNECNTSYETEWDYTGGYDTMGAWLTGVEHVGKVDIEDDEEVV